MLTCHGLSLLSSICVGSSLLVTSDLSKMEAIFRLPSTGRTTTRSSRDRRLTERHHVTSGFRSLAEYPMDYNKTDALLMLHERRATRVEQLAALQTSLRDTRKLSANSRSRFLGAISGHPASVTSKPTLNVEYRRSKDPAWPESHPQAPWTRPRHHSIVTMPCQCLHYMKPMSRPGSEPISSYAANKGQDLNHLRTSLSTYPAGLRMLLQDYNRKLRVECFVPVNTSAQLRAFTHCRLLPLEGEKTEEPKEQIPSKVLLLPNEEAESGEDGENEDGHVETEMEIVSAKQQSVVDIVPEKERSVPDLEPIPVVEMTPEASVVTEESKSPPSSFTYHCWVDDVTVSSVSDHKSDEADLHRPDSTIPSIPGEDTSAGDGGGFKADIGGAKQPLSKLDTRSGEEHVSLSTSEKYKRQKPPGRDKRIKEQERVEALPGFPPPEELKPEEVTTDDLSEEIEEQIQPVPPTYICPSSEFKSHQAEIKVWLKKSTFSAASRQTPIL